MFRKHNPATVNLLMLAILAIVLQSCGFDASGLKPATGRSNEILFVTNSNDNWKSEIGDTLKAFFGQELKGLPQPESAFELIHVQSPDFSQLYQSHHNIFILDINNSFDKSIVETKKDFWAKPQRVVKFSVADKNTFYQEFAKNKEALLQLFDETERLRAFGAFATLLDQKIKNQLIESFDISMEMPKTFYIAGTADNFVWIRREAESFSQGIIIYYYPYTDTMAFDPQRIIQVRDSVTKRYIPGPATGSYMKTASLVPPTPKQINFNDNFAVEMRGLWELEGDYMGGPFVSYTFLDPIHNRIITLDGYVYYPNQDKRNLLRQVESILYTFQFPDAGISAEPKK